MVSALVPGASGPGSSPGRGHCVVFLGMIIHLNCLSKISEKDVPLEVFLASLPSINYEKTNTTFCCDSFGCKYRSNITGIIYNNEMGDFSTPGQLNPDDIPPSKNNFIKTGKRPQSSISPVIFTYRSGRVRLAAAASGGPLITTAVSLVSNLK